VLLPDHALPRGLDGLLGEVTCTVLRFGRGPRCWLGGRPPGPSRGGG
jgi:hypothetical protein